MKFEADTLRNKEAIKRQHFFHENSKVKGGDSDNFCARVVHLVTYDVVDDQKLIFKVWSKYLRK
jgi:hypothetical protein